MTDVSGNYFVDVHFASPVNVAGAAFFIGVNVTGLNWSPSHDTLSMQSNLSPQTTPSATWELTSGGIWYQYSSNSSWNLDISVAVFPEVTNVPAHASFTQSATSICAGYPVTLNASGSTQNAVYWVLNGATPSTSSTVTQVVTYATAGTYPIKLYVAGGSCNNIDSMITSITVNASPHPNATATPSGICPGNSSTLNASGGTTYQWTGYPPSPTSTQLVTPTQTTVYTVTVTASNGCTASQSATITYNPAPQPNASANPQLVCEGNSVLLSTAAGMSAYLWTPGGGTTATYVVAPTANTIYTVSVTDALGCTATSSTSVTVDPALTTSISIQPATCGNSNGSATVSAGGGTSSYTYAWSTSPSQTTPMAIGLAQGTYYVTVTDLDGCTRRDTAVVNCVTGIADHNSAAGISLIPNPSSGVFILSINGYKGAETTVDIFNVAGQSVYDEKLIIDADIYSEQLDISALAKGIYYLRIKTADSIRTLKMVME